jgi:hypothetical protein
VPEPVFFEGDEAAGKNRKTKDWSKQDLGCNLIFSLDNPIIEGFASLITDVVVSRQHLQQ